MARIRTIKPEFQNSQSMGRVSRDARLLFIELWPQCDDAGRIRANSRMLASVLFPYDEDAPALIDGWLLELEKEDCIVRYRVGNDEYLQVCHWDHQKIDHPQPSKLPPAPEKKQRKTRLSVREQSRVTHEASENIRAVSSTVPEGIKDQGMERGRSAPRFDDFWKVCPKKVGRGKAEEAYRKACAFASQDVLIEGMSRYGASQAGTDPKYIAHPATWLNGKRWLDEPEAGANVIRPTAFNSQEELEGQRLMMERLHGQAQN